MHFAANFKELKSELNTYLKPNEGVPYYFDDKDVLMIFGMCSNIKHLAMLKTLFYGCLRSNELCKLDDADIDL